MSMTRACSIAQLAGFYVGSAPKLPPGKLGSITPGPRDIGNCTRVTTATNETSSRRSYGTRRRTRRIPPKRERSDVGAKLVAKKSDREAKRRSLEMQASVLAWRADKEKKMTRERVLDRIRKLMALAGPGSGAAPEEARSAAAQAIRLMHEHGLIPGSSSAPAASAIDLDAVASLSFQVIELENRIAERQRAHEHKLRENDRLWRQVVRDTRREERAAAGTKSDVAVRKATTELRENLARGGAAARNRKLSAERRREIGRAAAAARWARWRERHMGRSG